MSSTHYITEEIIYKVQSVIRSESGIPCKFIFILTEPVGVVIIGCKGEEIASAGDPSLGLGTPGNGKRVEADDSATPEAS